MFASFKNIVNALHTSISLRNVIVKEINLMNKLTSYSKDTKIGDDKDVANTVWNLIQV